MKITRALAYAVFDSRGFPTVAVLLGQDAQYAVGMSPSGASTGSHEAYEWRDGEESFGGKNIRRALDFFHTQIAPQIVGRDWSSQLEFDQWLQTVDGTGNFKNVGGNVAIAASIGFLRLQALLSHKEIFAVLQEQFGYHQSSKPITPLVNVINGGKHASSGLAIQEIMLVPVIGTTTTEKITVAAEIFCSLKKVLAKKSLSTLVGDEGGFAPSIEHASQAFELIEEACTASHYRFGQDIALALDVAATELYSDQQYHIDGGDLSAEALVGFYQNMVKNYPVISLEDPFAEDDFAAWHSLYASIGNQVQIVGDDLTVTNVERMKLADDQKLCSAMIVKPNQIGTISQTMAAIKQAEQFGWNTIISHRSGETEDTTIADIAYATGAPYIKTGSCSRSDRMAKYNRLILLEQMRVIG